MDSPSSRRSETLRHIAPEHAWTPAVEGDSDMREELEQHIERYFGPIAWVWHELASDLVHIDVHVVEPSPARPYFTLITAGMSDRPMTVPADVSSSRFCELVMCLPPDWPRRADAFEDARAYWPLGLLKAVARLPHEYDTWIDEWHSMPNGDPAQPYADGAPFVGVLVTPMLRCAPDARTMTIGAGKQVSLLALVPLHPAELALKLAEGSDALTDAFDRLGVTELLDSARPSSV